MKKIHLSKSIIYYAIRLCLIVWIGCAPQKRPICIKDGIDYGKPETVFLDEWHDYYRRALSLLAGECYALALSDLKKAADMRFKDTAFARTYGMHFIHYFPHREMGYIYYKLDDDINAKKELEISLNQHFTDKAQYYLDKVRSSMLKKRHVLIPGPEITILQSLLNKDDIWIKESPVIISARIKDPNYISRISLASEPVFLSSSIQEFDFQKKLYLVPGKHEIEISAKNLANSESKKSIVLHIDRSGPVIIVKKIDWNNGRIFGYLDDETDDIQIWIENNKISRYKGKMVPFSITFKKTNKTIKLHAKDPLGNQTIAFINQNNKVNSGLLLASAQKKLPLLSDVNNSCYKRNQKPEIILYGWNKTNTVYTNTVHINGFFKGNKSIEQLMINKKIITKKCKDATYFNEAIYLKEGNNKVLIESLSQSEHLSYSCSIEIYRKVPEHYQIKHRVNLHLPFISLDTISFPGTIKCDSHESNLIYPEKQQKCDMIHTFKAVFIKQLKETKRFKVSCNQKTSLKKNSDLIALINVFETKKDMEVFIQFVKTETEHTFNIFDAYYEKKYAINLKELSEKLIEKIKNAYQIHEEQIVKVNNNLIEIGPMKKPFMIHWPLIIFRKKPTLYNPETGESLGADAIIIGQATTTALLTNGCKAILDDTKKGVVIKDHVIQR